MLQIKSLNNLGLSLFSVANYHSLLHLDCYSLDYKIRPLECINLARHHMPTTPKVRMSSDSISGPIAESSYPCCCADVPRSVSGNALIHDSVL